MALEPDRFVTDSPDHLLRGMLRASPLVVQREFFERDVGIPLTLEEETGKLFPISGRARDMRDGLIELARRRGGQFQWDTSLTGLAPPSKGWRVETTRGEIDTRAVVLATGGLSVPKTGSDGQASISRPDLETFCTTRILRLRRSSRNARRTRRSRDCRSM